MELDGWRIGLLICYDVEFPETVLNLALAGADFVAVPTALGPPFDIVATHMVPTRAVENQVFLAYVNRCGNENGLEYIGLSCVVGPDGSDIARAQRDEALIFAVLERGLIDKWRAHYNYRVDRRPALYASVTNTTD